MPEATIAIIAIPNSGKTTLFNRLTGAHQEVGNWPGVTVEKKTGRFELDGFKVTLVDLPGAYAITPTTLEERIVRDYFMQSPPDLILNVVDATNLYRSLGLTLQLAMTGIPMVVAVNMMDEARRRGIRIDIEALSQHLGAPVVPIVARTGEGMEELRKALLETLKGKRRPRPPHFACPPAVEQAVNDLVKAITVEHLDKTFVAFRLLEGGEATDRLLGRHPELGPAIEEAQKKRRQVEGVLGQDMIATCAQCRFHAVKGLLREVASEKGISTTLTDRIDSILMHRWLGLPLFFLFMLLVFQWVFALGAPLQEAIAAGVHRLKEGLSVVLSGISPWLQGLLIDGVVEGVGIVVSFLPIIALFFVFLSIVEDTGYMARAAFLMDRIMHCLRLDGKAFISIVLGYGCNVPAVMGTRILASPHNRIVTMLLIPFSLCSARLQVFLFLSGILFASKAPWVVFSLYGASLAVILLAGLLLRPFRFGPPEPFIMELPPYRLPLARVVAMRTWHEVKGFLYRASTFIVLGVVVIWWLTHTPSGALPGSGETLAGHIGLAIAPLFEPLGIHWQEVIALLFGFIAKEIVIGALAVIYGGGVDLGARLAASMTPLQGLSFMVFTLIYTPCVATLATLRAEGSWRVAGLSVLLGLVLAWGASFAIYQGGRLLGYA